MQSQSTRAEFLVVVTVAFGYALYASILELFAPSGVPPITDGGLRWLMLQELLVLLLLGVFLKARGWKGEELGLGFVRRDVIVAAGMVLAIYAAVYSLMKLAALISPRYFESTTGLIGGEISLAVALAVSIVNPIFEEVFVCAYVIRALQQTRSTAFAVNVSILIRAAYHLYQGPAGATTTIPVGLVFAWWFARTGRLWPVIIAHGVLDLLALIEI